jgi:hypothetical protein
MIQLREILRPQMKDAIDAEHRLRDACVEGLLTMLSVYFATGTVVGSGSLPNAGNGLESSRLLQIAFALGMAVSGCSAGAAHCLRRFGVARRDDN